MRKWQADKRWSDRFLPEIKRILGEHLIGEPPIEEDAERNTDLIVLRLEAVRVACRIRKFSYLDRYGGEFTIRSGRPSGVKTEYAKIIEGWGDFFFYGFASEDETELAYWTLGSLGALRLYCGKELLNGRRPWRSERPNRDGSSFFRAFWVQDIPDFVVAQGEKELVLA